jgi:hypothetical protein
MVLMRVLDGESDWRLPDVGVFPRDGNAQVQICRLQ